jgi:hypothetical protein
MLQTELLEVAVVVFVVAVDFAVPQCGLLFLLQV